MPLSRFPRLPLALLALALSACSALDLRTPAPPTDTYLLDAAPQPASATSRSPAVLLVDKPEARPGYATPRIAYARAPLALDYYGKSEWAETPASMLLPLLVRTLERQGAYAAVIVAPAAVRADLRLAIELLDFVHEAQDPPGRFRLGLRASVFEVDARRLRASRVFEQTEPLTSNDAYGAVQAANRAAERLLLQLADFVGAQAPPPPADTAARRRR